MNKVFCFGNTQNGELGLGGIEDEHILRPRKQRLPYDRRKYTFVQLSSGRNHTLVLLKNIQIDRNVVFSCGSNDRLQLGRNGSWKKLEQVDGLDHHNVIKISCGFNNCLVLTDNGELFSWGCNLFGQLGLASREHHEIAQPRLIKLLATKQIVQISCGGNHCLALTRVGEVYAWGSNAFGQLGIGNSGNCSSTPTLLTSLQWTPVRQIAAGGSHSAVLTYTGAIYTWGKNEFGQLGVSDTENRILPTLQKSLRNQKIAFISLGDEHSAALTFEGGLFTWGAGMYGQLGHGKNNIETLPRKVFELMGVRLIQVSCGRCHTLVASKFGRVYSFGLNGSGQLGIGSTTPKFVPTAVRGPWSEIITKQVILRDGDRSLQVVNVPLEEEDFQKAKVSDNFISPKDISESNLSEKSSVDFDMEIDEINEEAQNVNIDDQSFIIEEPDDDKNRYDNMVRSPEFVGTDDDVFKQNEFIEIDEYETDPDSDIEEGLVTPQYIIEEVVASKGDQSFVILQPFVDNSFPKDFRKFVKQCEIMKLDNTVFEKMSTIPKDSIPLDIIDYIENVFTSFPAINSSYISTIVSEDEDNRNIQKLIQKFKAKENIHFDEAINFKDGWINWQQAFHGFNMIEDAQNKRVDELIYQNILKLLDNMPDTSFKNHKVYPDILDDEVMRVYQLLPLFHMFKMTSFSEESQKLVTSFAQSITKLSPNAINCLKIWWCKMNRRFFKNLIEVFKNSIKVNLLEQHKENLKYEQENKPTATGSQKERFVQVKHAVHYNLAVCLDALKILYSVNKYIEKISYKQFYIDGISDLCDLKMDYFLWKQNRYLIKEVKEYYLCNFPFIFDSPAKNIILITDSEIQQQFAAQASVRKQILMSIPVEGEIRVNPYLDLTVRRDSILDDTVHQLCLFSKYEVRDLKKPLKVNFEGEEAVDAGQGMKKEFFLLLMSQMLDKKYGMFVEYEETNTIWFNHVMVDDDDTMYRLVGILCGLAIYNKVIIDLPFPLVLYKKILDEELELEDLAQLDPLLAKNLSEILDPSVKQEEFDAVFGAMTFSITLQSFGSPVEYELCPGGKSRKLKWENREEYVELYWKYLLINSCKKQFEAFDRGFKTVLGMDILQIFQAEELMQLVEGEDVTNWEELENFTAYKEPFTKDHPTIRLFWRVFFSFSSEEKKKFLKFLTGSDRIPITGVKSLNLTIQSMNVSDDHLPVAHTCFNILDLPLEYTSENCEDKMRSKLLKATELATEFALV